jgi:phage FluMu protein Com
MLDITRNTDARGNDGVKKEVRPLVTRPGRKAVETHDTNTDCRLRSVLVTAHGTIIVRCKKCGMLACDSLSMDGATVKCPYCKSQYHYQMRIEAEAIP